MNSSSAQCRQALQHILPATDASVWTHFAAFYTPLKSQYLGRRPLCTADNPRLSLVTRAPLRYTLRLSAISATSVPCVTIIRVLHSLVNCPYSWFRSKHGLCPSWSGDALPAGQGGLRICAAPRDQNQNASTNARDPICRRAPTAAAQPAELLCSCACDCELYNHPLRSQLLNTIDVPVLHSEINILPAWNANGTQRIQQISRIEPWPC